MLCDGCIHNEVCGEECHLDEALTFCACREERSTGEWIPVSERFPQIATKCLVTLSNGYITIGEYFSIDKWVFIETSFSMVYPKETVIAWMPLPESYVKGDEEE